MTLYVGPESTKKRRKLPKTVKELQVQIALGSLDSADILSLLRSKKTSGDIIEILYNAEMPNVVEDDNSLSIARVTGAEDTYWEKQQKLELISEHPNTPASVLVSIFHQKKFMENPQSIEPGNLILSHPAFPVKLLREVFHKLTYDSQFNRSYSYLFKIIENPNIPVEFLKSLAKHKNIMVRALVAKHPNAPPEVLESLADDSGLNTTTWVSPYYRPREYVALNPQTPPYVLKTMSTSSSATIRRKVAVNPKTPVDTLKAMVTGDRSPNARRYALHTLFKLGKIVFTDE